MGDDPVRTIRSLLLPALITVGLVLSAAPARSADTGDSAPQTGRIVNEEPSSLAPDILDGPAGSAYSAYSIAEVGNYIVVGGKFAEAQNYNTSVTQARANLLAFDADTGRLVSTFAPDPDGIVYKVLPAADGQSVYVAGAFNNAAGEAVPGNVFKVNVATGVLDPGFDAPSISGDIRDLELVGNHLFIAGKFTHINGFAQKALGSLYADSGKRDPYFNPVVSGVHNPDKLPAVTNALQISVNEQNTQLLAIGNFTAVDGQERSQIAKFDISNVPSAVDPAVHQSLSSWSTSLFTQACSPAVETYMTDVEYAPSSKYFVVSTTGAYGGSGSLNGTSGCDVVARFEENATASATPTWTAYTGGDTTWTVEVTDDVIYVGGHQRWQNNPTARDAAGQGAVSRDGIAALDPVNGMPYSWNPTRERGVGVRDMLATSKGLYVGSDTDLIGPTEGNRYHARIAFLPLDGGKSLPAPQSYALPVDVYKVALTSSQMQRRRFTGTSAGAATTVTPRPGWNTSTGAFMVGGVLYKLNTNGLISRMTFDGTTFGSATVMSTSDALSFQTDWHNDVKNITGVFYDNGFVYYTKAGTQALFRRGFEAEDDVVGQQRFYTRSSVKWANTRGVWVAGGKLYFATSSGSLYSATWSPAAHNLVPGTLSRVVGAGTGWASRVMFPFGGGLPVREVGHDHPGRCGRRVPPVALRGVLRDAEPLGRGQRAGTGTDGLQGPRDDECRVGVDARSPGQRHHARPDARAPACRRRRRSRCR